MKYSIPQTPLLFVRTIFYTLHAQRISYFILLGSFVALTQIFSAPWITLAYFGALMIVAFALIMNYRASTKLYGDKDGQVLLAYDIQSEAITISVQNKTNIPLEKEGFRKSRVFKHGVYIKHKRLSFIVHFPEGQRSKTLSTLKKYKWAND